MNIEVSRSTAYLSPAGNFWLICEISWRTSCGDRKSVGAGQGVNVYLRAFLPFKPEKSRERFLAQLDLRYVFDAHHHSGLTCSRWSSRSGWLRWRAVEP